METAMDDKLTSTIIIDEILLWVNIGGRLESRLIFHIKHTLI